jgi:transcriptional regulator GlxA family with amidase domain
VRSIVFVVPVGVHLLDLAGPAQVFSGAVDIGAAYRPRYVGERERVPSHQGVEIGVDTTWPDLTAEDIVLVCGHHVGDRTPRSGLPALAAPTARRAPRPRRPRRERVFRRVRPR